VIVGEYAHFLEDKIGSLFALPSTHDGCLATIAAGVVKSPARLDGKAPGVVRPRR
jgi:hypothetical protein